MNPRFTALLAERILDPVSCELPGFRRLLYSEYVESADLSQQVWVATKIVMSSLANFSLFCRRDTFCSRGEGGSFSKPNFDENHTAASVLANDINFAKATAEIASQNFVFFFAKKAQYIDLGSIAEIAFVEFR
jgi:hypothetical protein